MDKIINRLETLLNQLVEQGPSQQLQKNFLELTETLTDHFQLKPQYEQGKKECEYCHKYISKLGWSQHCKSKKHRIAEAKHFGAYDFKNNDFK